MVKVRHWRRAYREHKKERRQGIRHGSDPPQARARDAPAPPRTDVPPPARAGAHAGAELLYAAGAVRRPDLDPHVDRRPLRAGAGRHRVRGDARRRRRTRCAAVEGILALRRRARQPRRLRQFRRGPGLPDLHLGPRRPQKPRLDLRDDLRARLGAAAGALQRRPRRGQAEVAVGLLQRHADAGRGDRRAAARLYRAPGLRRHPHRRRSCSTWCWSTRC